MTSPPVRVRRATDPSDVDALLANATALFHEDAGTYDPETVNLEWPAQHGRAAFEALVVDPTRVGLLAETLDGDLAGGLTGSLPALTDYEVERTARLVSLWVDPGHRGTGVGAQLVEAFLAWAREQGAPYAQVTAFAANERAIAVYERHGFRPQSLTLRMPLDP